MTPRHCWKPIVCTEEERKKGQAWALKTIGRSKPTARRRGEKL